MRKLCAFLMCLAPLAAIAAAPGRVERDLGQGLAYVRIHELPADLPPAPTKPGSVVLDLRFAKADAPAAHALGAWVQFRSSVRTPVLVLVNGSTDSALLELLESSSAIPGLVTIGAASSRYVPDISLNISSATERLAYDALEKDVAVATLLTDQPDKPRHDEASIAQEKADSLALTEDSDSGLRDSSGTTAATPPAPPPLIDAALQRAVHLHRAFLALKKI